MGLESQEPDKPRRPSTRAHVIWIIILMAALLAVAIALAVMVVQKEEALAELHAANKEGAKGAGAEPTPSTAAPTPDSSIPEEGHYRFAAVATDTLNVCSPVGTEIMGKHGGSAVDAAIATILCVGVANPMSNGIGGGHFMTVYIRKEKKAYAIVAREMAPAAANSTMFVGSDSMSTEGGMAVGVPGELMGLWEAYKRWGTLPWAQLLQPAIDWCEKGVPVSPPVRSAMFTTSSRGFLNRYPGLRRLLTNPETNQLYKVGERMKRPLLAQTLRILQQENVTSFYNGSLAQKIVAEISAADGIITLEDLANYKALVKDPLISTIHRSGETLTVHSPPAPSSGPVYQYILNILNGYNFTAADLSTPERKVLTYHRIVEAFKFAFAKRTALGDGDGEDQAFRDNLNQLVENMTSGVFAEEIRQQIWDNQTHPPSYYGPVLASTNDHGTAHLSLLAPNGDAVAITSTINLYFGSKVVGNETGIVYNDEMDDFSTPNLTNAYGVPASPANFIKPGKRPLSSTCPSIVTDQHGDVVLVVGASGGTRITTATALVTMLSAWFGFGPKDAVTTKRIHHQLYPPTLSVETGISEELIRGLESIGHKVSSPAGAGSNVQAVARNGNDITAYSDPRKDGRTDGY